MTLTLQGFKRKRYDEIVLELEKQARELFGANVNLSERSPIGQWVKLIAYQRAEENEALEDLYNADFVDTATGISLDHVGKRIGITRIPASYAKIMVTFVVDLGVTIKQGALVGTKNNIGFMTLRDAQEANRSITVEVIALLPGPIGNVPAGTITEINTPLPGVYSVTNAEAAEGGRNVETDAEFRERYYASLSKGGGASIPAIRAALLEVDGVTDAIVYENDTMIDSSTGIPAKSVAAFVFGGDDDVIARAIFTQKSGGIQAYGSTKIQVMDELENPHTIGFSRPTTVEVYVRLTLSKNADYPLDGDKQVKTRVVSYIGGVDEDLTKYDGLGLNGDVVLFKLSAAIAPVGGIDDVDVELSIDGGLTYTRNNVIINSTSIAKSGFAKVVIQ